MEKDEERPASKKSNCAAALRYGFLCCVALAFYGNAWAADIVVRRTLTLSGPSEAYDRAKMEGADLLIEAPNAKGGVKGNRLRAYDEHIREKS
jgi:ABC-type branched-subunit amino acid transport system substrate-binding protein